VSEWGPYPIAVWCSCAWFAGLTMYVCYWSFCHPQTPLCTEAPESECRHRLERIVRSRQYAWLP
jgi:hypothetical protein